MWRRREVNPEGQVVEVMEVGGGWWRLMQLRQHPRKHDVGSERLEEFRTDTRHAVEARKPTERAVLLAPRDDALRERRADPRQPRDLRHVGAVEVDALARQERAREPRGAAGGGPEPAGGRRVDRDEPHITRRGYRGWREREPHAGAGKRERCEQEGSTAVIHGSEDRRSRSSLRTRFFREGSGNRGQCKN